MKKKEFSFSTKATTLAKLQGVLQESEVPPLYSFTVQEWDEDPKAVYDEVAKKFSSSVVVRSSALNEDGYGQSMAGNFESVLDVVAQNPEEFSAAVKTVIESYENKDSAHHKNQVLVQEQVGDVQMSGVIFTQDLETGAPYYVVNYDDY
ncbi:pyruvate, phosphate dikinase, partial [Candidatus Woesearchaeota archaeon]|nr:pyruvate, phosphate dikinase [Candidatus Woesearchaeota archaeon]